MSAERRPLLQRQGRSRSTIRRGRSVSVRQASQERHSRRFWFVIPVVCGSCLAGMLPTTTTLAIIRVILCRRWYETHSPGTLAAGTSPTEAMCSLPEIVTNYSVAIGIVGVIDAVGAFLAYGAINLYVKKYGRKPVFIALTSIGAVAFSLFVGAFNLPTSLAIACLTVAVIISSLGAVQAVILVARMFIVDTTTPIQRTAALSLNGAAALLGLTPSFALGGYITTHSTNITAVYWVTLGVQFFVLLYEIFILPESYVKEDREDAREEMEYTIESEAPEDGQRASWWRRAVSRISIPVLQILEPLLVLAPRIPETGRRDFHLLFACFSSFMWYLGSHYIGLALMLRLTTQFHLSPSQNGFAMSLLLGSKATVLTLVIPLVIRYGRLLYGKYVSKAGQPRPQPQEMARRFDLYIVIVSYFIDAIFIARIGLANTKTQILIATALLGLGSGGHPALNSLLVASVNHLQSDEILAANAMLESVGMVLSPIVLGAILSATVNTFPAAMFLVSACLSVVAMLAIMTFGVLDEQRLKAEKLAAA